MPNKKGPTVVDAFERMLERAGVTPANVVTDLGSEFISKQMQKFLKDRDIFFIRASSTHASKAFLAENAIRILLRRIYKYMTENKTKVFHDVFQDLITGLNARKLRSLKGLSPDEITPRNQQFIAAKMRQDVVGLGREEPTLVEGDKVLCVKPAGVFSKAYRGTFDPEAFTVTRVIENRGTRPMYALKDSLGNEVTGLYYAEQLTKTNVANDS